MKEQHFEKVSPIPVPADELYAWHTRPGAFRRLVPPWQDMSLPEGEPEVSEGSRVKIRLERGPFAVSWIAEHRNVRPGTSFEDVQVRGPFASWQHVHEFQASEDGSLLRDSIHYRPPAGSLGALLAGGALRSDIARAFAYRHRTTAADLDLHSSFADRQRLSVAITGASGLVGEALTALLSSGGHRVVRLVRRPTERQDEAAWNSDRGVLEPAQLEGLDAVVHLAGENIGSGRWTEEKRRRIVSSRVDGTHALIRSLRDLDRPPRTFVSASAVGIYGDRADRVLDEASARGDGFLADVCARWEEAAATAGELGARVALLRFGVVISPRGGFLSKVLTPFRAGAGGVVGSGEQYLSWVSIDDAVSAVLFALYRDDLAGPVNVVAPTPVTNREMTATLGRVLNRPTVVPLPAFVARAAFGRMADEMLLSSTRAVPSRLSDAAFPFRHERIEDAFRHVLGR